MFNTGLTELASIFSSCRTKILTCQLKLIGELIKSLSNSGSFNINNIDFVKTITSNSIVVNVDANKACNVIVPILFGMLRSFGRISGIDNVSILSLIFHDYRQNHSINEKKTNLKLSETNDSISSNVSDTSAKSKFHIQLEKNFQSTILNLADYLNPFLGHTELDINQLIKNIDNSTLNASSFALNSNLEQYFKYTVGSSFYNGLGTYSIVLSQSEIKDLIQILKKLFNKNVIYQINRYLGDFINIREVIFFLIPSKIFLELFKKK